MNAQTSTHYCCQCRQPINGQPILAREPRGNQAEVCSADCARDLAGLDGSPEYQRFYRALHG